MKDVSQILKSLGLVDSEVKTYLQALQHGPSTIIDLTKYTGLSRQATYVAVESLTKRGLMSSVERGKKSFYAAEAPEKLLAYAERQRKELNERVEDLKKLVPELELQAGGEKPVVRVFEGKTGVRAMFEDAKNSAPKTMDEITDASAMYSVLSSEDLAPYRMELQKLKTKLRTIGTTQPSEHEQNIQRIVLDKKESDFKSHISVLGNKINLVTFEGPMHSIIIESAGLAKAIKTLFDLAFKRK